MDEDGEEGQAQHQRSLGDVDDPHLPPNSVDAVLISNTYYEFTAPDAIMDHVRQSLVPGGRIVIIDRTPKDEQEPGAAFQEHDLFRTGAGRPAQDHV